MYVELTRHRGGTTTSTSWNDPKASDGGSATTGGMNVGSGVGVRGGVGVGVRGGVSRATEGGRDSDNSGTAARRHKACKTKRNEQKEKTFDICTHLVG